MACYRPSTAAFYQLSPPHCVRPEGGRVHHHCEAIAQDGFHLQVILQLWQLQIVQEKQIYCVRVQVGFHVMEVVEGK